MNMRWYLFIGRILMAGAFATAAIWGLTDLPGVSNLLAGYGLPQASISACIMLPLLALAATSLLFGLYLHLGLRLIVALLTVSVIMEITWLTPALALVSGLVTIVLLGALIALLAVPAPWPMSVDAWLESDDDHRRWPWDGLTVRTRAIVTSARRGLASLHTQLANRWGDGARARTSGSRAEPLSAQRAVATHVDLDTDTDTDTVHTAYVMRRGLRVSRAPYGPILVQKVSGYIRVAGPELG